MSEAPYGAYSNRDVSFCPLSLPPTHAPHACFLMYEVGGECTAADDTDDGEERRKSVCVNEAYRSRDDVSCRHSAVPLACVCVHNCLCQHVRAVASFFLFSLHVCVIAFFFVRNELSLPHNAYPQLGSVIEKSAVCVAVRVTRKPRGHCGTWGGDVKCSQRARRTKEGSSLYIMGLS